MIIMKTEETRNKSLSNRCFCEMSQYKGGLKNEESSSNSSFLCSTQYRPQRGLLSMSTFH